MIFPSIKRILLNIWRELPLSYPIKFYWQRLFTRNYLVGVAGVIFNQEGQILLLKHSYRKEYPWGIPSGWLKRGEQPHKALIREIKEETGYEVDIRNPLIIEAFRRFNFFPIKYDKLYLTISSFNFNSRDIKYIQNQKNWHLLIGDKY